MFGINVDIIKKEVKSNFKHNKFIFIILLLLCVISFTLISMVIANALTTYESVEDFKEYIGDRKYYTLSDNACADGSYDMYMDSMQHYYQLKDFVNDLRQNEDIVFTSTVVQSTHVAYKNNVPPKKFRRGYEEGMKEEPRTHEGHDDKLVCVKSIHISSNVLSEFGITVEDGRDFTNQDFSLDSERDYVKVIMGSEYKEFYSTGDTFKGQNLFEKMEFKVIGFLPSDTYMPVKGRLFYLDRYLLIPAFSKIDIEQYEYFAKITLLEQANGQIILPPDKNINVRGLVNDLSNKYNTIEFSVHRSGEGLFSSMVVLSEEAVRKALKIGIILVIFTVIGLTTTLLTRIRENYYRFGVHLMCGATLTDIIFQLIGFNYYLVSIALAISLPISVIIAGINIIHLLIIIAVAVVVFGLSCVIPTVKIAKMDVNYLIRRKE